VEEILADFLAGRIRFAEFGRLMRPWVEMDLAGPTPSMRFRQEPDASIRVRPADLYPVLESYLAGKRDEEELTRWARVVDTMLEYGPGEGLSDEEADRLDPMWGVLARLGLGRLGSITPETVRGHLERLRSLEAELARGVV
jgi:hypothetical protein